MARLSQETLGMEYNKIQIIMTWTHKHQELAIKNGWWNSTINLASYIYKRTNNQSAIEFEFDANKFQKHITKLRGKPYDRTTIPKAMRQLEEKSDGLIVVMRFYGRGIYKLVVRPISFLQGNKTTKREASQSQNAGNPMYSEEQKKRLALQQQQYINKIDRLTENIGLKFDSDALTRIWKLSGKSLEMVTKAVKFVLYRNSNGVEKLRNPHGLLIDALRRGWAKDFDLYYEPELPTFNNRMAIDTFINDLAKKIGLPNDLASATT